MLELKFLNPVFRHGLNVTIRDAGKYDDAPLGQIIDLLDSSQAPQRSVGQALLVGVANFTLEDIPPHYLGLEHDPSCRTHASLANELDRIYGLGEGREGGDDRFVSVLTFFYGDLEPENPVFDAVVKALKDERDYQEACVRDCGVLGPLSLGEEVLLALTYLSRARGIWATDCANPPEAVRHNLRKVMAICARALTYHGIATRIEEQLPEVLGQGATMSLGIAGEENPETD